MKGTFHAPQLGPEFFPGHTFGQFIGEDFANGWFALDRIMLVRLFMAAVLVVLFVIAFRKPKLVPKGLQNIGELGVDFVRIHNAEDTLGKKEGRRFLPVIATIFFTILFFLHFLVVPIEFFSTFILRPVTLALRLMANFLAGHIILVLLYSATNFFFWQISAWTSVSGLTLIAALLFTLYELIIIFLQAYIFALLTAVYIELSLHADAH